MQVEERNLLRDINNFRTEFELQYPNFDQTCKLIVIDEVSTTSAEHLFAIHQRLLQINAPTKDIFGGLCVLLLGDFYQCPPVQQRTIAHPNAAYPARRDARRATA